MSHPAASKSPAPRTPRARWYLLEAGYAKSTTDKYKSAVTQFLRWCSAGAHTADTLDDLDDLLADYFHELYEVNEGRGKQTLPALARTLLSTLLSLLAPRSRLFCLLARCCTRRTIKWFFFNKRPTTL
jgi:hypothetical protein